MHKTEIVVFYNFKRTKENANQTLDLKKKKKDGSNIKLKQFLDWQNFLISEGVAGDQHNFI